MSERGAESSIYDLGYRRYDGPRVGRWGTATTLYLASLRSAFGLGRRTTSKIFPFALAVLAFVPALVQVGIGAITSGLETDVEIFAHEDYFGYVQIVLVLFCAAVAPELVGRDQRQRTLSLYFSRAVSRVDYTLAKLAALVSAMLVLTLGPQLLLFVGNGLAGDDLDGYLRDEWDLLFPILAGAFVLSLAIAGIGLAIASWVPRRAYATAAIVGVFVITLTVASILVESVDPGVAQYAMLASPFAWEGTILWFFRTEPEEGSLLLRSSLDGWAYFIAVLAMIAVAVGASLVRFRRIQA